MLKLHALLTSIVLLATVPVGAATLEPIGGGQSTRATAYFPGAIGAIVRDDAGNPAAGVTVNFLPGEGVDIRIGVPSATSDADGVAILASGVYAGPDAGPASIRVFAPGATPADIPLTVLPGAVMRFEFVSGNLQAAHPGDLFAKPWRIQAFDESNNPVPYAYLGVSASSRLPGEAWARFDNGFDFIDLMADADGIGTAPPVRAGPDLGVGRGSACSWFACVLIWYDITTNPLAGAALLDSRPPLTMPTSASSIQPFVVRVLDADGAPLAGVPVTFDTLNNGNECATFGGARAVTVVSGSDGRAASPPYETAWWAGVCLAQATAQGLGYVFQLGVFAYDPAALVIHAPDTVNVAPGQAFDIAVAFTAEPPWIPLYPAPFDTTIATAHSGATASFVTPPVVGVDDTSAVLRLRANDRSGKYKIVITKGPARKEIRVEQRGN